jgi:hypothetical protein
VDGITIYSGLTRALGIDLNEIPGRSGLDLRGIDAQFCENTFQGDSSVTGGECQDGKSRKRRPHKGGKGVLHVLSSSLQGPVRQVPGTHSFR